MANIGLVISIDDRNHMLIGNWIPIPIVSFVGVVISSSGRIPIIINNWGLIPMALGLVIGIDDRNYMLIGKRVPIPIVNVGVDITTDGRIHAIVGTISVQVGHW